MEKILPKRRWLQFSLRTLLIATSCIAVICGLLSSAVRQVCQRRALFATIEQAGGQLIFDPPLTHQFARREFDEKEKYVIQALDQPNGPSEQLSTLAVLKDRLGVFREDYLARATSLDFHCGRLISGGLCVEMGSHAKATDATAAHIKELPSLKYLDLGGQQITNAGMENLAGLTNLECLWLDGTQIDDAGLQQLRNFKRLRKLFVGKTRVTLAGLAILCDIPQLELVSLDRRLFDNSEQLHEFKNSLPKCNVQLVQPGSVDHLTRYLTPEQIDQGKHPATEDD